MEQQQTLLLTQGYYPAGIPRFFCFRCACFFSEKPVAADSKDPGQSQQRDGRTTTTTTAVQVEETTAIRILSLLSFSIQKAGCHMGVGITSSGTMIEKHVIPYDGSIDVLSTPILCLGLTMRVLANSSPS